MLYQESQDFIHWYHLESSMKRSEKESIHPIDLPSKISSFQDVTKI